MSFIRKPQPLHTHLPHNDLGLTQRDYEGAMSTLCAGCGHDSVSAAFAQAFFELSLPPHRAIKVSGIGCSSKTPAYFLRASHGMNSCHGRMPAIATGASAANRELALVGVSGDGDTLSIGFGQFSHAMRRNLNMLYVLENNGVYGLTKGQFSASAEVGTKAKRGEVNQQQPLDPVLTALGTGCTFIARSFSGDKTQLVPLIKAGLEHDGFAMLDVISPCVTFNDHEGSMKSYAYTREVSQEMIHADYVPHAQPIEVSLADAGVTPVTLHDGSHILLRKTKKDYDPTDRAAAFASVLDHQSRGEIVTGLLYLDTESPQMHTVNGTIGSALVDVPYRDLCPGGD
ncbi:MAG: 2-oxoacid:ferredoxin oxidoreductase subunit beta, partial [Chromatiales bacterium]|nr:2-oxoacid:ferredoxin oxidoreductase subunit beta [Chromatiales bacterium]